MSDSTSLSAGGAPSQSSPAAKKQTAPASVLLVPYPKIVFLYPLLLASVVAAVATGIFPPSYEGAAPVVATEESGTADAASSAAPASRVPTVIATLFLMVFGVNLVILAFDFPRTTSLTLFFFAAAVVMGIVLLATFHPDFIPELTRLLARFTPLANAHFYWAVAGILLVIFLVTFLVVRFDYWEVRPNELLHHHGFLSNMERLSAPNLRIDKEVNDVFEYLLLRSGRLIVHASNERRAIILDNVPNIRKKEEAITRMLGALQVQVRQDNTTT
jgi:hypothetical protein